MSAITIEEKMLYCPKCNQKYEDGSQRFCNNDGGRLLPETSVKRQTGIKDKSVFTNLLGRTRQPDQKDEKLAAPPKFVQTKQTKIPFEPPQNSKIFKSAPEIKVDSKPVITENKVFKTEPEAVKVDKIHSRLIKSNEIKIERAELGDRRTKPTGREAVSLENAEILLGKLIKGRYQISKIIERDEASIAYLADDQIIKDKQAIVRVLMEENSGESLEDKIFAEERVSLSHINHPNIAKFIDSGELPEGKSFIVTEFNEGESVRDILNNSNGINPMRVARIISQASYALSEVHQNGILHRSLKPEHILLSVNDSGKEIVRVTGFSVSSGRDANTDFAYKSPEQVGGQLPTFSSDTYSLGVIAYEMLTGKKPFDTSSARSLLKSQKKTLANKPSELKPEFSGLVDEIIEKTLSYNALERYPKARDFGDALYNSLMTVSPWEDENKESADDEQIAESSGKSVEIIEPLNPTNNLADNTADFSTENDISAEENDIVELDVEGENKSETEVLKSSKGDTLWEKRSPEPTREGGIFTLLSVLGLLALIIAAIAAWQYFNNQSDETPQVASQVQTENLLEKTPTIQNAVDAESANANSDDNIEVPPPEREITPLPNSKFYENLKQNLDSKLAKNYRGFSVYFPKTWDQNEQKTNFLDISKKDENGLPKEQMIITHYDSNGTFALDEQMFDELVEGSNADLKKSIPNYEVESKGSITVNNGWKSYEVKFKGKTKFKDQENFEIWGRRIWMPAARPGVKNGFVITMLATSLSDRIENLDDVGKKGDLGDILYTFEPDRNY